MKKRLLFLPMMFLLLTGCGGGQEGETGAEALAVAIRGEYMAMTGYSLQAQVNADYGQRVYDFTLSVTSDRRRPPWSSGSRRCSPGSPPT